MRSIADLEAWLDQAVNRERSGAFGEIRLEGFRAFLRYLPPAPAPCTVGGTKGKGSTVRLIEAGLLAVGQRTVAFTSPHVHQVTERWRLDGHPVTVAELAPLVAVVTAAERRSGIALSYFERTAALAVLLAADRPGCHLLWEVGLGGRLDCANAFDCRLAVLTHLSHDHRDILGPTLRHIAAEKLPIARVGRPLLIAPQTSEGHSAIAAGLPARVTATWVAAPTTPVPLALAGQHQQDNAATALAAVRLLVPGADAARALAGMATAQLAARCQLVAQGSRRILVDGAHNGPSIAATLAVAATGLRPGWRLVLGVATDKEIAEIQAVLPHGVAVHRCGYDSPRARGARDWPAEMLTTPWFDRVPQALLALPEGDLCVTGSFYLAGEALAALGSCDLPG
jgi:dihydrofolate synthase/folylpolyglutamate synthase